MNVSAAQLHNINFARLVHEILLQTGMPARRLELEITETALIRDLDRALATLRQLKALGVRIAMDDFGTGYSSLSNLRAFPFDKIKVDSSFVRSIDTNEQAATIVRAVLGLGRGLGLPVLAEGVETQAEMEFLSNELCDEVQGFLLGRPVDIKQFRGKLVCVFFWDTSSKLCLEDMPQLKALYDAHRSQGFEIIGVNLDPAKTAVGPYLTQHAIKWQQIHEPGGLESAPALSSHRAATKVGRLPTWHREV